jgi:hypothetical protein
MARWSRHTSVLVGDHGAQAVGDDDVAQQVPRFAAELECDLADDAALVRLPRRVERLQQPVAAPVGDRPLHAIGGLCQPIPLGPRCRVAQLTQLLVDRECHQAVPAVEDVEDESAREVQAQSERVGQRECEDPTALGGSDVVAGELVLHEVPVLGVHL